MSPYVEDKTVGVADLLLYNLFDIWFDDCESLNNETIMLTFDLSTITTGIFLFLQYDGESFTTISNSNLIKNDDGSVTVLFNKITPIALYCISQSSIDVSLNSVKPNESGENYVGEPATTTIVVMGSLIMIELFSVVIAYQWSTVKKNF